MKFGQYIKTIKFSSIKKIKLPIASLSAQYNPDRFKYYKASVSASPVLSIVNSSHCAMLVQYKLGVDVLSSPKKYNYYQMQKKYQNSKHAFKRTCDLVELYEDIKKNGLIDPILILEKPLIANSYNNSYEIYEGHHRASCCYVLGLKYIESDILKVVRK